MWAWTDGKPSSRLQGQAGSTIEFMKGLLTIGKVAGLAGVSAGTIRYYERVGLLPPAARTQSGYRVYQADVVHRVSIIRQAQHFGFPLREIASFLQARDRGGRPCHGVREAGQRMLSAIDAEIRALRARRQRMAIVLRQWDERLARTPPHQRAHLLEMLGPDRSS
jgi:DNA-binding transcriptional MerR regulator